MDSPAARPDALLAPDPGARLGRSRARVLDVLRSSGAPLGVRDVAGRTGLHPNTARFHLDGLAGAGLATRERVPRPAPGRPGIAYRAADQDAPTGSRRYRLLAMMLAGLIEAAIAGPAEAAVRAGRDWGGYLAMEPPPHRGPDVQGALAAIADLMDELGFAPRSPAHGDGYRLALGHCPFLEVAREHQDVVCSLHLGLIQGALARMRAPLAAGRIEPFAEPGTCVAHLTADTTQGGTPRPGTLRPGTPPGAPG